MLFSAENSIYLRKYQNVFCWYETEMTSESSFGDRALEKVSLMTPSHLSVMMRQALLKLFTTAKKVAMCSETAVLFVNFHVLLGLRPQKGWKALRQQTCFPGEVSQRCVYVGLMPRMTSEEMIKVIFPMANSVMRYASDEDPNMT